MMYLAVKIWIPLLVALLVGLYVGWTSASVKR
jgi:hypothetical protein